MSSRGDYRRRDRSWERDDRDRDRDRYSRGGRGGGHRDEGRRRTSRSRSPPRRGERERRRVTQADRRDHGRDREDERRDRDRRDGRRRDDGREREDDEKRHPATRVNDSRRGHRLGDRPRELDVRERLHATNDSRDRSPRLPAASGPSSNSRPNLDPDAPSDGEEDGEAMDATNEHDTAMMAVMGLNGFGTTKGKHVEGNQEGALSVKKVRTWRQYMNRRGGFNRPLDKIK